MSTVQISFTTPVFEIDVLADLGGSAVASVADEVEHRSSEGSTRFDVSLCSSTIRRPEGFMCGVGKPGQASLGRE
jgi:hypothetical protein